MQPTQPIGNGSEISMTTIIAKERKCPHYGRAKFVDHSIFELHDRDPTLTMVGKIARCANCGYPITEFKWASSIHKEILESFVSRRMLNT